ncbi:hypothetical protein [Haladaptatus sp. R4]|nr:hypothetical protein [Haladaptatus sp. R4]
MTPAESALVIVPSSVGDDEERQLRVAFAYLLQHGHRIVFRR